MNTDRRIYDLTYRMLQVGQILGHLALIFGALSDNVVASTIAVVAFTASAIYHLHMMKKEGRP